MEKYLGKRLIKKLDNSINLHIKDVLNHYMSDCAYELDYSFFYDLVLESKINSVPD